MLKRLIYLSMNYPKVVIAVVVALTVSLSTQFLKIRIDTDPENMLSYDEPVRATHREVKKTFNLYDAIVVGVVKEDSSKGVFTPETLRSIARITDDILKIEGVIGRDVISPTTTDDIQLEEGILRIDRLMEKIPEGEEEADKIRMAALDNPLLKDMLISKDGKAIAIYVPVESKDISYRVSQEIKGIIDRYKGDESYYITGLPVAEDTFGVEMFKQMAISAPLAMLIIFLLMLFFFRSLSLIVSPMIVAMISVIATMGLLIGMGFTVHIMSSMIPIFLMPIAVVDSVHILSEFYDRYPIMRDRKKTVESVFDELFKPMLYTSLTSTAGFASLTLTPIPPVRVFGIFVAFGIMLAWILTITVIPAYIALIPERYLEGFGFTEERRGIASRLLGPIGRFTIAQNKLILTISFFVLILSVVGISGIVINDNPVNWFKKSHPIRVADRVLNSHFGGTYIAYLVLTSEETDAIKSPHVVSYIEKLQRHIEGIEVVGKTTSVADVVKKIGYELHDENPAFNKVPDDRETIGQYLFLYEMAGDPEDLYHLIDYSASKANIWIQLKSGDNLDMKAVEDEVNRYIGENPLPEGFKTKWAGLPYLNVEWQEKMVWGQLKALMGSFVTVFCLMVILQRSLLWSLISMVPLTVTIFFIYGLIGFAGKDYDMPIAVLSALTLGLSIDFAIHFCQRTRQIYEKEKELVKTVAKVFEEPVRAIMRNAVVIAVGFLPLLLAPLVPYQTVGFFLSTIMMFSGIATLIIMPALVTTLKRWLFPSNG